MSRPVLTIALALLLGTAPVAAGADDVSKALTAAAEQAAAGRIEEALDTLRTALDAHPGDARILLELGRTAYLQAKEVLRSGTPALGRLALVDAVTWLRKAVAAKPDEVRAHALLGEVAVASGDFATAAEAYRRAAELAPGNGEYLYQLGYSLAYQSRFAEAIEAFAKAMAILGPDPRIFLNRGISHASLEDPAAAEKWFLRLVEHEIAAKRPGSDLAKRGFVWLWRIHSSGNDWKGAERVFRGLSEQHPGVSSVWWYMGHALREDGRPAEAADAFRKVTELSPGWAEGFRVLGETLVRAKRFPAAVEAMRAMLAIEPGSETGRELLLSIAKGLHADGQSDRTLALLTEGLELFPDDSFVLERRADLGLAAGRYEAALRDYRKAIDLDPFADELVRKEQKAATGLLRSGGAPPDLLPLRREEEEPAPAGKGGSIVDFEGSAVFPRLHGAATGGQESGVFRMARTGPAGPMANLCLTFIPTLDTRGYDRLRFDVKGPKGKSVLVRAMDGYDEFSVREGIVRLLHRSPATCTGERRTVTLPLDGFEVVVPGRPLPFNRARLRALLFEVGSPLGREVELAGEVEIDDVRLVDAEGAELLLADFEGDPAETLFLTEGVATPFARTLSSPQQLEGFRPDPNTFVTPAIMGDEFDPATVHGGSGSYRMTLPATGEAFGSLTFNPDRSYDRATALSFWARGRVGGEKLRVTIEDALDREVGNEAPASAPRLEAAGRLVEGAFVLGAKWKRFRIPRAAFPDVDFRALARIRFRFGTPVGNPLGTTIYLDDVGWE